MTKKEAVSIIRREAADIYALMYDEKYKKVAAQAFSDGLVFAYMCQSGAISDDMINEDFFRILRENN